MNHHPPPPPPPPAPSCPPPPPPGSVGPPHNLRGPSPITPMKRLQWSKIPEVKVKNSVNLWTNARKMFPSLKVNFDKVEELFSCKIYNSNNNHHHHHHQSSNGYNFESINNDSMTDQSAFNKSRSERFSNDKDSLDGSVNHFEKRRKYEEVNLLDPKKSMNVNIFIRQLRLTNLELVEKLKQCDTASFEVESLKTLSRLIPDEADKSILISYKGDRERLGSAEKFYLALMSLPNFDLIIQTLLLKEELFQSLDVLKPAIDSVIVCSKAVKDSVAFHEVLYLVLMVGNFLNAGAYSGDAAAFKLCSLLQLSEIKANDNKLHLMHYVAQEAESRDSSLADQLEELKYLSNASLHNISALYNDMKSLKDGFSNNINRLKATQQTHEDTIRRLVVMETAIDREMTILETEAQEVECLRIELAKYFCEDETTFKLDECMNVVNSFCKHFLLAHEENKEKRLQAEKAEMKRLDRQRTIQRRLSSASASPTSFNNDIDRSNNNNNNNNNNSNNNNSNNRITPPNQILTHNRSRSASCTRGYASEGFSPSIDTTPTNDSHLLDILLRPPSNPGKGFEGRKFNSLRINRRRSRNVAELCERERFSSPLDFGCQNPINQEIIDPKIDGKIELSTDVSTTALVRNGFARSSCPSRVQNSERENQSMSSRINQSINTSSKSDRDNDLDKKVEARQSSSSRTSKKLDLDRRLSREVAMGAASVEQQIRELESSLQHFDRDLELDKTLNNNSCKQHPPHNEPQKIPKIHLSSPEKLERNESRSEVLSDRNKNDEDEERRNSRGTPNNMRERMKKLTQLYSGNEPLEVQVNKPSTFGKEINASDLRNFQGILRDPRHHNHNHTNGDKHTSDPSEFSVNFKDEGFDSEGFSNTSASQKSSRSSSRERDSGQIDWKMTGCDGSMAHQFSNNFKNNDSNKTDDNMSVASSNNNFDRSIESLVSKELTVIDCSLVNKSLNSKTEFQDSDKSQIKFRSFGQKQGNVLQSTQIKTINTSILSKRGDVKSAINNNNNNNKNNNNNNNVKATNSFSFGNKINAMLNRTASKPASRVIALADTKISLAKKENKRDNNNTNNRALTPTNKARSLSRQVQSSPKMSRDSSTKSGQSAIKVKRIDQNSPKAVPRSSSTAAAGSRTPRNMSTMRADAQKRPSIGSSISSDTKINHVSRDSKPRSSKISMPNQFTSVKLSNRSSPLSTPQSSSSSSTPASVHKRTPSICSSNIVLKSSNFVRQSSSRSTLPSKLFSTLPRRETKTKDSNVDTSTIQKLSRPIRPNMIQNKPTTKAPTTQTFIKI